MSMLHTRARNDLCSIVLLFRTHIREPIKCNFNLYKLRIAKMHQFLAAATLPEIVIDVYCYPYRLNWLNRQTKTAKIRAECAKRAEAKETMMR